MTPAISPLTHTEAEKVGERLAQRWHGLVGSGPPPPVIQCADLVQAVLRWAAEAVAERAD